MKRTDDEMNFTITLEFKPDKWQRDILNHAVEFGRRIQNGALNVCECLYEDFKNSGLSVKEWKADRRYIVRYDRDKHRFSAELVGKDSDKGLPIYSGNALLNGNTCGAIANRVYNLLKTNYPNKYGTFGDVINTLSAELIGVKRVARQAESLMAYGEEVRYKRFGEVNSFPCRIGGKQLLSTNKFDFDSETPTKLNLKLRSKKSKKQNLNGKSKWSWMSFVKPSPRDVYLLSNLNMAETLKSPFEIVRKMIRGKERWFFQLNCKGTPFNKGYVLGAGRVGLDIGTSTVAISSDESVTIDNLPLPIDHQKKISVIQRKLDRSRLATNPECFNDDGTFKKGKRITVKSKRYLKLQRQLADLQRKEADYKRNMQGRMANEIVSRGNVFITEADGKQNMAKRAKETKVKKNGKYASKKRFGKSIGQHAPSGLKTKIRNRVTFLGGRFYEANTFVTKASQFDHTNGECHKVGLKARRKTLSDGSVVQRDMYSAYCLQHLDLDKIGLWQHDPSEKKRKVECKECVYDQEEMKKHFEAFRVMQEAELNAIEDGKKHVYESVVGKKTLK